MKGVTPDIYYGTFAPAPETGVENAPRLIERAGLADCLSVFGSRGAVDANTAQPAVLAAVGLSPEAIAALVARRREGPLTAAQLQPFLQTFGAAANGLRLGGGTIFTFRATARPRFPMGGSPISGGRWRRR